MSPSLQLLRGAFGGQPCASLELLAVQLRADALRAEPHFRPDVCRPTLFVSSRGGEGGMLRSGTNVGTLTISEGFQVAGSVQAERSKSRVQTPRRTERPPQMPLPRQIKQRHRSQQGTVVFGQHSSSKL